MKTQVIKLDSHDDAVSVHDKMSWAKTERILLVFPRRSRILEGILDLRLLQRHAARLGAELAIVTRSVDLRQSAEEIHIPAFDRVASAQRQEWERKKSPPVEPHRFVRPDLNEMRSLASPPEARWRSNDWIRFSFFSLGVLAILAVLIIFIPSATIQLTPATRLQSLELSLSSSAKVTTVNLAGSIPARSSSIIVEHSKTAHATGVVSIPNGKAQGMARFRNLTTTITGIPAGTVISTQANPPVRFITTSDGVVAAGVDKTVDIPIQAVEAGSTGNLPAAVLIAIEGDLGTSLTVTNPKPTTGGTNRTAAVQTALDRTHLQEALLAEILVECKNSLPQTLAPGDVIFPDTLVVSQVLAKSFFPAEGQSGDTLSLTMRLQCQAQFASISDITSLGEKSLDANLPGNYIPASSRVTMLPASTPTTGADGVTHWQMQAERLLRARLDPLTVVQLSVGRKPAEVISRLKVSRLVGNSPDIQLTPGWWPWLPIVPFRIAVSIGN